MTPRAYSYIRFSTPEQERGDSLRRQLQASQKWAEEHGIELDTSLNLRDLGLSGYDGTNLERGALGQFLQLVKQRRITKGSILLVESFDRLTRQQVLDALNLFTSIIQAGITIVTLADNQTYTEESVNSNPMQLMTSILVMVRAHEESLNKSKLISAAWAGKRGKINQEKLTKMIPEWLCLPPDRREFQVIPDRAKIVAKIFDLRLKGYGSSYISRILNEEDRYWNPGGWQRYYVDRILRYPAVYGVHQPYSKKTQEPIGDPIRDYFPIVVPEETFLKVQDLLKKNQRKGGQTGKGRNVFRHLVKCGYCGAAMHFCGSGKYLYLVCKNAFYNKRNCDYLSLYYPTIEKIILNYCKELDPSSILPSNDDTQSKVQFLQEQKMLAELKLEQAESRAKNLERQLADVKEGMEAVAERLWKLLAEILKEKESLQEDLTVHNQELEQASRNGKDVKEHLESINQLYAHMERLDEKKRLDLRLRLRAELRRLLKQIRIYAEGNPRFTEKVRGALLEMCAVSHGTPGYENFKAELDYKLAHAKDNLKIVLEFSSGITRIISPYHGIAEVKEMDEEFGTAITQSLYGDGRGGEVVECDNESRQLAEEYEGF